MAARASARIAAPISSSSTDRAAHGRAGMRPNPKHDHARALTVVQLLPALESGGVERSTIEIAQALTDAGHRSIVVSAGGRLLPVLRATGAEHVEIDIGRKSLATLRHVATLRRLFADV